MNQLNQNITRNKNCLKCYKIEKKLLEKWEHFQDIIFNSRIFTVLKNRHTEIEQIKPMFAVGSLDGSFRHIHPANPTIYYQNNYKIIEWEKSAEPKKRKIIGYDLIVVSDLIKNQDEYCSFELKSEKEWENILEFYRDLFNKNQLTFEKTEHIQDFLKEIQPNKIKNDKLLFDLCLKLIEKILAEKQNKTKPFWEKMEQARLMLEIIGIPASIIFSIIEIFKKNNKGSS